MLDLKRWECGVPGKEKTIWEGGLFKLDVTFPDGMSATASASTVDSYRLCPVYDSANAEESYRISHETTQMSVFATNYLPRVTELTRQAR